MSKIISASALIAFMAFGLAGCAETTNTTAADEGEAPDYARKKCWLQLPEITKDVDTFYIYSTAYYESSFNEGAPDHAPLDNPEMLEGAQLEYMTNASVYESSTNVFVPYYRQAGMKYAGEIRKKTGNIDAAISGIPYDDITAALDHYFEKCNHGRPFIIAGHSQGSAMVKYILTHYFKEHPEYYKRMVAAYVIGFSVTKDDLAANPHLKFAAGENDTGVIVSWNTEGPKNVKENAPNAVVLPGAISINPLNWRLDETYAPASANLGSFMPNLKLRRYEIADIGADAQIVLARGVIVTNAKWDHPADPAFFGPQSFHEDDYTFYYNNLKENVAKRIAAYKARAGAAPDYSRTSSWYKIPEITKQVDTFFVYPTEYLGMNPGDPDFAPLDNPEMREGVKNLDHKLMASVYEDSTNLFMPYYRQAGFKLEGEVWKKTGDIRAALTGTPYDDITAALDYYFKHCNQGRPFILAGHSQGSAICTLVLKKYFKEHPEYYKRMVAAYIIGFSVSMDELAADPHLKFATGESDTGVIVSWNTEGPRNVKENAKNAAMLPHAVSINPLNWKLDGTYAPPTENLGSLVPNEETGEVRIGDLGADAQVDVARGVVVTNAKFAPMEMTELFGPQSFHNGDYIFYYNNIKANVAKRIESFLK